MALTPSIADFFARALAIGAWSPGGQLLEFGESVISLHHTAPQIFEVVAPFVPKERYEEALRRAEASIHSKSNYRKSVGIARAFYHIIFEPSFYMAIELGLGPRRLCVDLNGPVQVSRTFDYVVNNGTSEHVFDQANVYRLIHEFTRPGGVMVHWQPCIGWTNHGLFHPQPGFFFDLAAANEYEIKLIGLVSDEIFFPLVKGDAFREGLAQHPSLSHSLVCTVLRKVVDQPFKAPIQEFYQAGLDAQFILAKAPRRYVRDSRPNLALNKPASQSSTGKGSWHDDPVEDAAGGNNGMITGYYNFCTDLQPDPWWMVDLGEPVPVQEVVVYDRIDTLPRGVANAAHLEIFLSQDGESWSREFKRDDDTPFGGADGKPLRVPIYGRAARFVRVGLSGPAVLCL